MLDILIPHSKIGPQRYFNFDMQMEVQNNLEA